MFKTTTRRNYITLLIDAAMAPTAAILFSIVDHEFLLMIEDIISTCHH